VMSIAFPSSSAFDDSLPLIANCYSLNWKPKLRSLALKWSWVIIPYCKLLCIP
jgi:hypothetical protein